MPKTKKVVIVRPKTILSGKRKQLQSLARRIKVPANQKNEKLREILMEYYEKNKTEIEEGFRIRKKSPNRRKIPWKEVISLKESITYPGDNDDKMF